MQAKRLLTIALLAFSAGSLQPAAAQVTARVTPLMLQQWQLGQELGRYGLANNDPLALLTAARLQRASGMQPSRARVEGGANAVVEQTDAAGLLAQARVLARDQPELLAMIDSAAAPRRTRGTLIGPQVQPMLMAARDSRPILLSYKPGQKAFFGISSDRLQDVALSIRGPRGEPLCEPAPAPAELLCEWDSADSSEVRAVVTNRSANAVLVTFFHD
ncbi:hypothetical protein [Ramlibacter albus]|uniref:Uncharacterized protein n=1 Tax=Ramlibacter albus TaxID=2079448 RepID=A0A923M4T9_9BURK|nr:hypothetical protein [Ramlibacter albus]MBC5763405.1 hypothetical protein [Ramlibacter albus]